MDQYLKKMKHLRSFNYDFLLCGHDYTKAIGSVIRDKKCKDIIWIPHPVSQHSTGNKHLEVENIIKEYRCIVGGEIVNGDNGITLIRNREGACDQEFKILNLINEELRKDQKKFIHSEKIGCPDSLDVIIAMGMFKEGANWIHANRGMIVGERSSLVDILQMLGRLLRDAEGKDHAELIHLLPFSLDQSDENFGENLNSFLKAVLVSLLLEELIQPVTINAPKKDQESNKANDPENKVPNRLTDLIPDPAMMHSLSELCLQCMLAAKDESGMINYEKYNEEFIESCDEKIPLDKRELIAKKFWRLNSRKSFKLYGINVDDIDVEIVKKANPLEWMIRYTSETCNIDTLERFREALFDANEKRWNKSFKILKDHFELTGDSAIPQNLTIDGINLFNFATVQRRAFKKGKITEERQARLESLPLWYWDQSESRDLQGKRALTSFVERERHSRVSSTHIEGEFPLGYWINQKKDLFRSGELLKEEVSYFESFPGWIWSTGHDQTWEYGFSLLQEFVEMHGHAQPTSNYKLDGFHLATWVKTLRGAFLKGELSNDKIEKLSKLPGWSWRVFDDRNNQGFKALDSFVKREGHALVPTGHVENGFKLGRWVAQKRSAYQNPNSKNKLPEEDIRKFELYPWWFWNGDEGRWEWGKQFLLKFIAREGHSRVKYSHLEDGFELGRWIGIWRYQYKKKILPQWKIEFFEALPQWSWDVKVDRWYEGFNILKGYVQREKHASVPANHIEGDFKLGIWVRTQKYSYIKQSYGKKLSQEKINLLESLPGWSWDNQLEESWNEGYEVLMKFVKIYGHGDIPARYVLEGFELGTWVSGQRYSFKKKRLPAERIALLEKVPRWVWRGSHRKPAST